MIELFYSVCGAIAYGAYIGFVGFVAITMFFMCCVFWDNVFHWFDGTEHK